MEQVVTIMHNEGNEREGTESYRCTIAGEPDVI